MKGAPPVLLTSRVNKSRIYFFFFQPFLPFLPFLGFFATDITSFRVS